MNRILRQIEIAEFITDEQKAVLPVAQAAWEEYAKRQAEFAARISPRVDAANGLSWRSGNFGYYQNG